MGRYNHRYLLYAQQQERVADPLKDQSLRRQKANQLAEHYT